jgi:hypothetical protein
VHNCRIRCHLEAHPNRKNEYSVGMYRIALLGWLCGLLLAIPILGIVKVVSHHIEELDLVAELLKKCWRPSIRCRAVGHRIFPSTS